MGRTETAEIKETMFEIVAAIAGSFGSPARLKILQILAQAPRSVDGIARITGESVANTSQHLQRLFSEGLVLVHKEKLSRIYRLSDERVALIIESLFDLATEVSKDLAAAEDLMTERELRSPVELSVVLRQVRGKKAVMLDVRDAYEFSQSPVDGALSIPLEELKKKAKEFSKDQTYYLFCRGRACQMATIGVKMLRSMGLKAFRLKECPLAIKQKIGSIA